VYEAKKRYGLCVLNYIATSNHIHLLVFDDGKQSIPKSMQLIASRTAQQFNQRKMRKGAYWEDRYHATAIQTGEHLRRCLIYIDLNMVRAGVVKHPSQWQASGYREIQFPPIRKRIIDIEQLANLCELNSTAELSSIYCNWVETALNENRLAREAHWSEAVAVGSKAFIEQTRLRLGILANGRSCLSTNDYYQLKEQAGEYHRHFGAENMLLIQENGYYWDEISDNSIT